jgi:hypothetical protein
MTPEEIFLKEGFVNVYTWEDVANTKYAEHFHQGKVSLFITAGEISFSFPSKKEKTIVRGQRFDVPVQVTHSAVVGKNGCSYVVGEMIAGDS